MFLPANNLAARSASARLLDDHLTAHLRRRGAGAPLFWVTLIAKQFAMPSAPRPAQPAAPHGLDPRRPRPLQLGRRRRSRFYSNVRLIRDRYQRVASWHVHLLLWDLTGRAIA